MKNFDTTKRKYVGLLLLVAFISFLIGANIKRFIPVAIVNGENISTPRFTSELLKSAGRPVMSNLIAEKLIYQEAKKKKIIVAKQEIKNKVAEIEDGLNKQHLTLNDLLVSQNRSRADLEHEIELQFIIEKRFKDMLNITDKNVENYFSQAGIKKGEDAIYESQKIAIINNLRRDKLRDALSTWIAQQNSKAKIQYLIKL